MAVNPDDSFSYLMIGGDPSTTRYLLENGDDAGLIPTRYQTQLRNVTVNTLTNRLAAPADGTVGPVRRLLLGAEYRASAASQDKWESVLLVLRQNSDGSTDLHRLVLPGGIYNWESDSNGNRLRMNANGLIAEIANPTDLVGPTAIRHVMLLLPVEVMRVWSDQLPGVEANYLADAAYNGFDSVGTGNDDKKYIFIGAAQSNNFDGKGHIKAQVKVPDQFKDKIVWRLAKFDGSGNLSIAPGGSSCTTYDSSSYVVTITVNSPDDSDTGSDYILVGGYDTDGDGQLSISEASIIPNCLNKGQRFPFDVKIVSTNCYNNDLAFLASHADGWIASHLPHAASLLKAFLYQNVPSEATSTESTTIDRRAPGLDHPVGILFDASETSNAGLPKAGPGTSITAVFAATTQMSSDVVNSTTMNNWLDGQLSMPENCAIVRQYFTSHPNENVTTLELYLSGSMDFAVRSLGITIPADSDLGFAFGKVNVSVVAEIEVNRGFYINNISLSGSMNDLYDFDFDNGSFDLSHPAASVQAGYNTLGVGGRVYRSRVEMMNSVVPDFQFQFPQ